jgi:hypothetical protein
MHVLQIHSILSVLQLPHYAVLVEPLAKHQQLVDVLMVNIQMLVILLIQLFPFVMVEINAKQLHVVTLILLVLKPMDKTQFAKLAVIQALKIQNVLQVLPTVMVLEMIV